MITSNPPRLILSFFSTESAFKVSGATETAATTRRDVKENPVPANRASRFYPGRNHDCSRRDCVAGRACDARDASGAETSASFAGEGRSTADRRGRRSICNRNPKAARLGCIRHRLDRLSKKRNASLHDWKGCARARFRFADSRSNPNRPARNVRPACRCRRRRILGAIYPIDGPGSKNSASAIGTRGQRPV